MVVVVAAVDDVAEAFEGADEGMAEAHVVKELVLEHHALVFDLDEVHHLVIPGVFVGA